MRKYVTALCLALGMGLFSAQSHAWIYLTPSKSCILWYAVYDLAWATTHDVSRRNYQALGWGSDGTGGGTKWETLQVWNGNGHTGCRDGIFGGGNMPYYAFRQCDNYGGLSPQYFEGGPAVPNSECTNGVKSQVKYLSAGGCSGGGYPY